MIGGADFKEDEGEGLKWQGGLLYIAGGARVGGLGPLFGPYDRDRTTRSGGG